MPSVKLGIVYQTMVIVACGGPSPCSLLLYGFSVGSFVCVFFSFFYVAVLLLVFVLSLLVWSFLSRVIIWYIFMTSSKERDACNVSSISYFLICFLSNRSSTCIRRLTTPLWERITAVFIMITRIPLLSNYNDRYKKEYC